VHEAPTGSRPLPDARPPDRIGHPTPDGATRRPTPEGESPTPETERLTSANRRPEPDAQPEPDERPEPEAEGHADRPTGPSLSYVLSVVGPVVAPATLVSALLFYFGYVSARAQFAYFGVDVDALGFSTQEFVMRAPQPLLVPALLLLLGSAGLTWAHGVARRRLESADVVAHRVVRGLTVGGAVLLAAALVLPSGSRCWALGWRTRW
jgi:hypothetical protein